MYCAPLWHFRSILLKKRFHKCQGHLKRVIVIYTEVDTQSPGRQDSSGECPAQGTCQHNWFKTSSGFERLDPIISYLFRPTRIREMRQTRNDDQAFPATSPFSVSYFIVLSSHAFGIRNPSIFESDLITTTPDLDYEL